MNVLLTFFPVAIVMSVVIDQAIARPRAEGRLGNEMLKNTEHRQKIEGNNTEKRGKESKNDYLKNIDLIKSIEAEYENYQEYDSPIIDIFFKSRQGKYTAKKEIQA